MSPGIKWLVLEALERASKFSDCCAPSPYWFSALQHTICGGQLTVTGVVFFGISLLLLLLLLHSQKATTVWPPAKHTVRRIRRICIYIPWTLPPRS